MGLSRELILRLVEAVQKARIQSFPDPRLRTSMPLKEFS